jgi:CHASE2 domain-containing sensor protein
MKIIIFIVLLMTSLHAKQSTNISIVYIPKSMLEKYNFGPLPRGIYADFINQLYKNYHPKALYIHITFNYENNNSIDDQLLSNAIKKERNIILSSYVTNEENHQKAPSLADFDRGNIQASVKAKSIITPMAQLLTNGAKLAVSNIFLDEANNAKSIPLIYNIGNHYYPSMLLEPMIIYKDLNCQQCLIFEREVIFDNVIMNKNLYVSYFPQKTFTFDKFAIEDIINGSVNKEYLDNRVVLLGFDVENLSFNGQNMSDIEFLANGMENFLYDMDSNNSTFATFIKLLGLMMIIGLLLFLLKYFLRNKGSAS